MYRVLQLLTADEVAECRRIAAAGSFVEGRISNPHNRAKQNLQLHDGQAYQRSASLLRDAMLRSAEFREFCFPAQLAPPLLTRYGPGMHYGMHADAAYLELPGGTLRSDISCTIFLSDLDSYDGGALHVRSGDQDIRFRLPPGQAILYPSTMLHEVEPVTRGERLVAITFIQSRVAEPAKRELLFELNEVAALEGLTMQPENYARLQVVQANLQRLFGDQP